MNFAMMIESVEVKLRKIFKENKIVFIEDLGLGVASLIHYHEEILTIAREYGTTICFHKPNKIKDDDNLQT